MSNLIKSGFVSFAQDKTLIIDANKNKIIKGIDSAIEEAALSKEESYEEAIAEQMLKDAEMEGLDIFDPELRLTMDASDLNESGDTPDAGQSAEELIHSAKKEAEGIINRAHDEAEQLRGAAYDEAEGIRSKAHDEGYQTGLEEGKAQGLAEYEEKNRALDEQLDSMEEQLALREKELVKETEQNMVEWLCKMIPHITGVSIDGMRDVLLYMVNTSMRDQEESRHFVIKVSPEDYQKLSDRKNEIYGALNPSIELELFEDAKLSSMQCMIETDNGIVDVSLDTQLDNLIKALKLMVKD